MVVRERMSVTIIFSTRHYSSAIDQVYKSDNLAVFFQYDQRFWDRLSISAGVRAE